MDLPPDFATTLTMFQDRGILNESPERIQSRLALAVQTVALQGGERNLQDLGIGDWTLGVLEKLKTALHKELCDQEKKTVKDNYKELLNKASSPEGVTAVAAVVLKIVAVINPTFAVSSVVIFLSIWLLKRGLNHWCGLPA
jgi:hypothetical protein